MIGASKILTVSYGTFSCTLEGFDEPFNTMKAIAEYFRDLAAEDRYFGAEPPTPDAAMLHKIAEREIQRRVEAKIQDNGVILRAGEAEARPAAAPEPARLAPMVSESPTLDVNGDSAAARLSRLRASQSAVEETPVVSPPAQPVSSQPEPEAAPQTTTAFADDDYSEDQHAEEMGVNVLKNIAAMTSAPAMQVESEDLDITADAGFDDFTQADAVDTVETKDTENTVLLEEPVEEDFGDLSGALADLEAEDAAVDPEQDPVDAPQHVEHGHEIAASAEMLLADTSEDDTAEQELEDEVGYFDPKNSDQLIEDTDQEATAQRDEEEEFDATAQMLASVASQTATPVAQVAADDTTAPEAEAPVAEAEAPVAKASLLILHSDTEEKDETAALPSTSHLDETSAETEAAKAPNLSAEEALAEALGIDAPQARAMITDEDSDPSEEEPAVQPQRARVRVIKVRRIQTTTNAGPLSSEDDTARADDIAEAKPFAEQAAPQTVRPTRPMRPVRPELSQSVAAPSAEAAFSDANKDVIGETEAEVQAPAHDSRHVLAAISEDDAVNRLMAQTNSEMDGPEARRRSMAISHLKAAVAATEADRQVLAANPAKPQPDRKDIYRSDLNSVVRVKPSDSNRSGSERPSPLVLVSEQRIDRVKPSDTAATPRVVMPTRPSRVPPSAAFSAQETLIGDDQDEDDENLSAEEASANLFSASQSFADFAEQLGAESLHDLLEAAAVYCAQVLGRPQFSRPMVMSQISSLPQGENHKLEEQLRAFGTLMREGRITKVKRGAFAVTDRSPLLAEALRNVG
jgi:hypothetical protein